MHIKVENPLPIHVVTFSLATSCPRQALIKNVRTPLFLSHLPVCYWMETCPFSPPITTIKFNCPKCSTVTQRRWQLKCPPKRRIISFNRRRLTVKAEVSKLHRNRWSLKVSVDSYNLQKCIPSFCFAHNVYFIKIRTSQNFDLLPSGKPASLTELV
jgi:hypothetical protein